MRRTFGVADLLASSVEAQAEFVVRLSGLAGWYPRFVDVLLELGNHFGELAPRDSDRGKFEFFSFSHYSQIPYTFWATYDLMSRGFYLEASILVRNILEVLVQLRYFSANPSALYPHLAGSKKVQLKQMFDLAAPGFYDKFYGEVYSRIAHGKGGEWVFRLSQEDDQCFALVGNHYDEEHATFVANGVTPLVLGFLNLFTRLLQTRASERLRHVARGGRAAGAGTPGRGPKKISEPWRGDGGGQGRQPCGGAAAYLRPFRALRYFLDLDPGSSRLQRIDPGLHALAPVGPGNPPFLDFTTSAIQKQSQNADQTEQDWAFYGF